MAELFAIIIHLTYLILPRKRERWREREREREKERERERKKQREERQIMNLEQQVENSFAERKFYIKINKAK